jgi:hypothetical protein
MAVETVSPSMNRPISPPEAILLSAASHAPVRHGISDPLPPALGLSGA